MTVAKAAGEDRYLSPGTKVRRDVYCNDDDHLTSEFGVVVHCWLDDAIGMFDCYIAFFGPHFPNGAPVENPYILRYAATSLVEIID